MFEALTFGAIVTVAAAPRRAVDAAMPEASDREHTSHNIVFVMLTLAPHWNSTAADLMRLLAVWLALIVAVQGLAAARALGAGPLHRHLESVAPASHAHHHSAYERHQHEAVEVDIVVANDGSAFNAVSFAITAALALMALGSLCASPQVREHVLRAARNLAWRTHISAALRKPPRPA